MYAIIKQFLFVLILLISTPFIFIGNAQTPKIDSLNNLLNVHTTQDTVRVNLLNKTADNLYRIDLEKTFEYATEANTLSKELDFTKGKAESTFLIGLYYERKKDYLKALEYYQKSIPLKESLGDKIGLYDIYTRFTFIYSQINDYPAALNFGFKSLQLGEEMEDLKYIEKSYGYIGIVYKITKDYDKSLEYFKKSIDIGIKSNSTNGALSANYNNVANTYKDLKKYVIALEYYNKALFVYIEEGSKKKMAGCYYNLGKTSYLLEEDEKALQFYNKSLSISIEIADEINEVRAYMGLAEIFFKQRKKREAYNYAKKGYAGAIKIPHRILISECAEDLAIYSNALGLYKEAYDAHVIFKNSNDSLYNEKNVREMSRLEFQYKYEKENEHLKEQQQITDLKLNHEKNIASVLLVILVILSAFIVFIIINRRKLKKYYNNELNLNREIKESEEKFRYFFEDNKAAMLQIDPVNQKVIAANSSALNFYGYKRTDFLQKTIDEINTIPQNEINDIIKSTAQEKSNVFEFKHVIADGTIKDVEIFTSYYNVAEKIYMFIIVNDISVRKKAELEIRKLSEAVEQSSATIVVTDTEGKIEYVNPSFTETTDYSLEEAIGKNTRILKTGQTTKEEYKKLWEKISSGDTWQGEFLNKKRNNEEYWENAIISPVKNDKGVIINYVAIKEDITEKKKSEQALKESEAKLKESNKTKDMFFSIISHDLRSPFNGLLGFSKILLDNHKKYDDERREQMIGFVNDSANSAFNLLENLLTWSRSQLNAIEFSPSKLNLKEELLDTLDTLTGQAKKKEINVIDTIPKDLTVFADENMLATVIRNLVSNAIKFTPRNGEVKISANLTESNTVITVADNGVGIDKTKLESIFDIGEKTSSPGTEKEGGTGLGLVLCKEFVEKHGGKIWVESSEGDGSIFSFTIPINK